MLIQSMHVHEHSLKQHFICISIITCNGSSWRSEMQYVSYQEMSYLIWLDWIELGWYGRCLACARLKRIRHFQADQWIFLESICWVQSAQLEGERGKLNKCVGLWKCCKASLPDIIQQLWALVFFCILPSKSILLRICAGPSLLLWQALVHLCLCTHADCK